MLEGNQKKYFLTGEKGVALYFAVIVLIIVLGIALGLGTLTLIQFKVIQGIADSVSAFFAADAGIECKLYEKVVGGIVCSGNIDGQRSYQAQILLPGVGSCPTLANYCIVSNGLFKSTRRAIRVSR
jgi:hypothetical protein